MDREQIYRITDWQTTENCYILIEGEHALIIDPNRVEEIEEILEQHRARPEMVILTHEHGDHILGLNALRERYTFQTIASNFCSERIQDIRSNLSRIFGIYLMFVTGERVRDFPRFVCEAADVTFEDRLFFDWRGHHFEMVLTPGHSMGSCAVVLDGTILFSGDSLFGDRQVVTRFDGGSEHDFETIAIPYYRSLPENIMVYAGHGEPFLLKDGIFEAAKPVIEE